FWNPSERVWFKHVNAGVDGVARDFVSARLLEKPPDIAVRVGLDEPIGRRIFDRRENDRRLRLSFTMERDDAREINLSQHVAVEDDNRFVKRFAGVSD